MALSSLVSSGVLLRGLCRLTLPRLSAVAPSRVPFCASTAARAQKEWIEVTYQKADGTSYTVQGKEGDNLLDVAINNDLDLDGFGACEGTLACSTCHLVFKKEDFDNIEEMCTDEELDMLDLAYGLTDEKVDISLPGCGFLGIYLIGALDCLKSSSPSLLQNANFYGVSAGALLGACILCDVPLNFVRAGFLQTASETRKWAMGAFTPGFNFGDHLNVGFERLPPDAHLKANGRLHVSVTRMRDMSNVIISEWDSREDLIQTLRSSCYILGFSGMQPPLLNNEWHIDGGYTNRLPHGNCPRTISISPYSGCASISPREKKSGYDIKWADMRMDVTYGNFERLYRSLMPPPPHILNRYYHSGYQDALHFLRCKKPPDG
ncbi:patatin-like phospholipase domain-containing protein 2 isoform X1 [Scylla paramamosain]|uniref:patatin-like phospholipase domain-containing protein 2 isoform X1 n=1 Tax=Scylla paramamosain TaxID=85552 RepID=UPI00308384C9